MVLRFYYYLWNTSNKVKKIRFCIKIRVDIQKGIKLRIDRTTHALSDMRYAEHFVVWSV